MSKKQPRIILGSSSPQRLELLSLLVPREEIEVIPPKNPDEKGFDDCETIFQINKRLMEVVASKFNDVAAQVTDDESIIISADTVIVVKEDDGSKKVLGKPPGDDTWPDVVRGWFRDYYINRKHAVHTAFAIGRRIFDSSRRVCVTTCRIKFWPGSEQFVDWYIKTGEPVDKAGGYGFQSAGSLFVQEIEGSPSIVIGLPLIEIADLLKNAGYEF